MNWRGVVRRLLAFVVVAVIGFAAAYLVAAFVVFPSGGVIPQDVQVPAVTGLPYDQAETELRRAGLAPEEGETRFHATSPKGTVLEQTPAAGSREPRGTKIVLAVSGGQASQPVPSVIGMSREDAEQALEQAGFAVGATEERSSPQPRGEIIDTRPRPGTSTTVQSEVVLIISAGQSTIGTPDVIGLGLDQARQILIGAGLSVGAVAYDVSPGATVVTSQSPAASTQVPQRTAVSLRVSGEVPP